MKVLFVGNYRDGTGWGYAGLEYIQALDAVGVEVACRPVRFSDRQSPIPDRVAVLERADYRIYDAVVQNVLPHHLDYSGAFPFNVALYYTETSSLGRTRWSDRVNCMDTAWVSCQQSRQASIGSGVTIPTQVTPIPCDVRRYERSYEPLLVRRELTDQFIFYTIGEFNRRKNFAALLTAFHLEFDVNEPVSLLIKTTPKGGEDAWTTQQGVMQFCDGIKRSLKLFDATEHYKKEIVLADRYSDIELLRLHASCDCGVFPSYGEAWCLPAFDSMAMGKTPIVTDWGGFREYLNQDCGWFIEATLERACGTQLDTFPDLHTAYEEWANININGLMSAMRSAYADREFRRQKALAGTDRAHDFSRKKIGSLMKELLLNSNNAKEQ